MHDFLHGKLASSFGGSFVKINMLHSIDTRSARAGMITAQGFNSVTYGTNSIFNQCTHSWNIISNHIKNNNKDLDINKLSRNSFKKIVITYLLNLYEG